MAYKQFPALDVMKQSESGFQTSTINHNQTNYIPMRIFSQSQTMVKPKSKKLPGYFQHSVETPIFHTLCGHISKFVAWHIDLTMCVLLGNKKLCKDNLELLQSVCLLTGCLIHWHLKN